MSDSNERIVRRGKGMPEVALRLQPEKLSPAQERAAQRPERKYNMRFKEQDLALLDALADHMSRPRSQLINDLLHRVLLEELMSIEDRDARALVAVTADKDASYDPLARAWVIDALRQDFTVVVENVLWHTYEPPLDLPPDMTSEEREAASHTDAFNILRARIEGLAR